MNIASLRDFPTDSEAGESRIIRASAKLSPASRAQSKFWCLTWGSRPRLYADVRSAD